MHDNLEKVAQVLTYRNRPDIAKALRGSRYTLNESSTYGSRFFSTLTAVEIYAPIQKHDLLQKMTEKDKKEIIKAFHVLYPVRENDIEINHIEFLIDPDSPMPLPSRQTEYLNKIDYEYITEQVKKCDSKIADGDFEGAITNARSLLESICKYILDDSGTEYNHKADLPDLYKEASKLLNMHPSQHVQAAFKQILSGCFSIVQGFAAVRNDLGDAHGKSKKKHYKPDKRHAEFVVGTAKIVAEFMYASFVEKKRIPHG